MNPNILRKTKAYLIGHMQYANGQGWRNEFKDKIAEIGVTCFDPYDKPFEQHLLGVDESDTIRDDCLTKMQQGDYDSVATLFKHVRNLDLALCDKSDFIVGNIIPSVASWGTAEELSTSAKMKKPIFLIVEGGKVKTPLWILGMIPHSFIFDSVDEVVEKLRKIDNGEEPIQTKYWRLLRKEYR